MEIAVFGLGYVGSVTVACLASLGHKVVGVDVAEQKVRLLNGGRPPVTEPGLDALTTRVWKQGTVRATTSVAEAVAASELAFICVGTPATRERGLDSSQVRKAVGDLGSAVADSRKRHYQVLNRSTCLPDVHEDLRNLLRERTSCAAEYVVHPEFIREGNAINDFLHPPLVVYGLDEESARPLTSDLYPGVTSTSHYLSIREAALIKYASNILHAVKVTFANEMGMLSNAYDVDARKVMDVICQDHTLNISSRYLRPGLPFGGSCLPKDLGAVLYQAEATQVALPMFSAVLDSNNVQIRALLDRVLALKAKRVALVGLAFKKGVDDVRHSPMLRLAALLQQANVGVVAWDDSIALGKLTGANLEYLREMLDHPEDLLTPDIRQAAEGADAVIVAQEPDPEVWARLKLRPEQTVFDLVGHMSVAALPCQYEGLYWTDGERAVRHRAQAADPAPQITSR